MAMPTPVQLPSANTLVCFFSKAYLEQAGLTKVSTQKLICVVLFFALGGSLDFSISAALPSWANHPLAEKIVTAILVYGSDFELEPNT